LKPGGTLEALDYKQLKWPGHGLDEMTGYQFVEGEYMKADEYDQLLYDPTDFVLRTYWPTLKRLIQGLIEEDCTPIVFWEGDVESRLEIIGDIPPGKAIYGFERTDMFKAKEIIGGTVCLKGNVPLSMLVAGTPDDVKAYCKKLIDVVGKGGGFIMDSSTVVDDAKPENLKAMIDFTKEYGVYA